MGTELLLRVFRHFYLEEIDRQWVDHLTNMEHLRDGIGLRGYGQRDPKQEYKKEGYDVFITMMAATSSNVCTKLFKVQVRKENDIERMEREDAEKHAAQQRAMQMRHGGELAGRRGGAGGGAASLGATPAAGAGAAPASRGTPKIGRNDPCPCGSGQKFKKCHGEALEDDDERRCGRRDGVTESREGSPARYFCVSSRAMRARAWAVAWVIVAMALAATSVGLRQRRRREVRHRQGGRDAVGRVVAGRLLQPGLRLPPHDRAGGQHRRPLEAHRREPLG